MAELEYPANYWENLPVAIIVETRRGFENVREITALLCDAARSLITAMRS
ncbi:hypothetical protein [Halotia branconii]|uniref:Uncharacterized protein n=1 Tax=Halotia branconii CENA392 TaxID=1539056 RepID=A0AAJ6NPM4_9CYAN|nr:hypothetical protein [Halotia branconii]WGV24189.1 hypothetical protein QI031_20610 [Halotia branconii CENA392]